MISVSVSALPVTTTVTSTNLSHSFENWGGFLHSQCTRPCPYSNFMTIFAETVISSSVNVCYLNLFMLSLLSLMHSPNRLPVDLITGRPPVTFPSRSFLASPHHMHSRQFTDILSHTQIAYCNNLEFTHVPFTEHPFYVFLPPMIYGIGMEWGRQVSVLYEAVVWPWTTHKRRYTEFHFYDPEWRSDKTFSVHWSDVPYLWCQLLND